MDSYSGAHVIEAFILGGAVTLLLTVTYYRKWSKWAKKAQDKMRGK